jgi:hypothetical protein
LPGDFSDDYQQTFDNAVSGIAKLIREAQPKVEQQNQKEKVKLPPRKNRSIQQQISDKPIQDLVVVQADQFSSDGHTRVLADRETGDITVERIDD